MTLLKNKKKIIIIILIAILSLCLLIGSIKFLQILSNNGETNYLRTLELGETTKKDVEKVLGKPDEKDITETKWAYYDDAVKKDMSKIKKLLDSDSSKDVKKGIKLLEELSQEEHKFIYVGFNSNGMVNEVFCDMKHYYNPTEFNAFDTKEKTLKSVDLSINDVECSVDEIRSITQIDEEKLANATYYAKFNDKSFYRGYCGKITAKVNGNVVALEWEDEVLSYKKLKYAKVSSRLTKSGDLYCYSDFSSEKFRNDSNIVNVFISRNVTKIEESSFKNCYNLQKVTFESYSKLKSIGASAFEGCVSLISIEIPNGVSKIAYNTFKNCSSLTSVEIPNSVTSIEYEAFSGCSSLQNIKIPNTLTRIGEEAFSNCVSLTNILIPKSVTRIDYYAFVNCVSLTIYCEADSIPNGWNSRWNPNGLSFYNGINKNNYLEENGIIYVIIDEEAAVTGHTSELKNLILMPSKIAISGKQYNVTSINEFAFSSCESLSSVFIPTNITSIESLAFYECPRLTVYCEIDERPSAWEGRWVSSETPIYWGVKQTDIIIQDGIQYLIIDEEAVITGYTNDLVDTLFIPSKIKTNGIEYDVTSIGQYVFYNCDSLSFVFIPSSVVNIGDSAFTNCGSLTIYCEVSSKPDGWNSYWNSSNRPVYWKLTKEDIIVQLGIQYLIIDGKAVVTGRTKELENNVVIPSKIIVDGEQYEVTKIGQYAFSNCATLTSIIIPSSVTSIEAYAFRTCSSLTIYCEVNAKPEGWHNGWNSLDNYYEISVYWVDEWSYVDGIPTPNNNNQ